ncbi:hypothetical protein OUZ56_003141 [Daphnia magna]|uniref:Uncharacterized protein n=1 Tax=Daphnia magna TaxID=35525 RepID=A0ABR0A7V6_9CRUS|nr:hypothetical protein OUZ56_003141 [Daphnia magna]
MTSQVHRGCTCRCRKWRFARMLVLHKCENLICVQVGLLWLQRLMENQLLHWLVSSSRKIQLDIDHRDGSQRPFVVIPSDGSLQRDALF